MVISLVLLLIGAAEQVVNKTIIYCITMAILKEIYGSFVA